MNKSILVLPGDGIGPEVTSEAMKVIHWFNEHTSNSINIIQGAIGGDSIDQFGVPITSETINTAKSVDSILLGAVGGPQWDSIDAQNKPEQGLLKIRKELDLFSNLRPAKIFPDLISASPLKSDIIDNVDLMIVRELTGDVYFGEPRGPGFNTMRYSEAEIIRVARMAFDLARKRQKRVCSIDKANVLETSMLWRTTVQHLRDQEYSDITLTHMYVDNAAMQLIRNPKQFDVLLTPNLFGDILSDEASMLVGSLGLLPSASLGHQHSLYEPIHGSAPDIAGQNKANPLAAILSVGMMFEYTFEWQEAAKRIQAAVSAVLQQGLRTADLATQGQKSVTTSEMGDAVIAALNR